MLPTCLAVDVPVEFGAGLAGGTDVADGEAGIVGHGDEGGFAVARVALDADLFGIDGFVGFEIVDAFAGAPGPGFEHTPVVGGARLAFVDEADDALDEAGAVVGLDAGGDVLRVAPASGENLLLPGGSVGGPGDKLREALGEHLNKFFTEPEFHDDGYGAFGVFGGGEGEVDVDFDLRVG